MKISGSCHHSINVITLYLAQSDNNIRVYNLTILSKKYIKIVIFKKLFYFKAHES